MRFIGQYIQDFIARFRNDVYLESISSGTIASGGNLGLDSNNKIVKAAISSGGISHDGSTADGVLTFKDSDEATVEQYLTFANADNISTLSLLSNQDTGDLFKIDTTRHGATTISTTDDDAVAAHLTFFPDGDLKNQIKSGLNYWYKSTNTDDYLKLEIGDHGQATFTTVDAAAAAADITFTPDGKFLVNSDDIRFISDQANDPMVQIRGEANDATGPRLRFLKNRGADGQDNDVCGILQFYSYDDGTPSTQNYAEIKGTIHGATAGQESGKLELSVASHDGGVDNGLVLTGGSADTEVDVTVGNGTSSVTTIAGTLTMGSTAFVNNSGVVQVATQGTIDHDSLANFVANEHIDWTGSSAGTIHSSNIPTLNQDTTGSAATLTTARAFQTDLASTSTANFDGSAANTHGVTGTLAVGNGGTGNTSGNATGLVASTSNSIGVGSIELGHADDTTIARSAAGKITVEGKEVRTADRQIQAVYTSFQADDIDTKHYLAFNDGDSENTSAAHVDMPIIAPFAGKLLSVSIRQSRNTSSHVYTLRLETQAAGVTFGTGPTIVGTQSGNSPSNTSIVTYDFTSSLDSGDNVIDAGDVVHISIESNSSPGGSTKYYFTCLFEWDYSSV